MFERMAVLQHFSQLQVHAPIGGSGELVCKDQIRYQEKKSEEGLLFW